MEYEQNAPANQPLLAESIPGRIGAAIYRFLPLLALLLGLSTAAYPALSRDLWTDEAYTVSYTFHPSLGMLLDDVRKNEETPPVYFVGTWLWARLFGQSEEAIRSFSVVCGALAIAAFARLAQRRLAPAEAAVATAAFLLAPLLQYYMLEARSYALTLLMTVLCISAFELLGERPERRSAQVAYGLSAGALFLTSYFGAAIIATHWLLWLGRARERGWRRGLGGWILAQTIAATCLVVWLPSLLYQLRAAAVMTHPSTISPYTAAILSATTLMGYPLIAPLTAAWAVPALAGWALVAAAFLGLRAGHAGSRLSLRAVGLPILVMVALVVATRAMHPRYMITLVPGLAIAIGVGYNALRRRVPRGAFLLLSLLLAGMLLCRLLSQLMPVNQLWPKITPIIAEQASSEHDVVLFLPPWDQRTFEYYYSGPAIPLLGAHHYDEFYYIQGHNFTTSWTADEAVAATKQYRRVWCIYNPYFWDNPKQLALPYKLLGHWQEGQLELLLYEVTPP